MMKVFVILLFSAVLSATAKESIVFVGAHPDDSEGFAATAFLLKERYDIHVVDLTRGELGLGWSGLYDGSTARTRVAEEMKACSLLGATPHFLFEIDGSAYAGERSATALTKLFLRLKPKAVFTHWPVDGHADHVQAAAVVMRALRDSGLLNGSKNPPERYFFEVLARQTQNYVPLYYVDVSRTMESKISMLRCYACQNENDSLVQTKLEQARHRGAERVPRVEFAETFTTFDGRPIAGGVLEELPETVAKGRRNEGAP